MNELFICTYKISHFAREKGKELRIIQYTDRWNYSALAGRQVSIYWFGFYVLIILEESNLVT